eukprot:12903729-Prorocentrum_lima.AAC.1
MLYFNPWGCWSTVCRFLLLVCTQPTGIAVDVLSDLYSTHKNVGRVVAEVLPIPIPELYSNRK